MDTSVMTAANNKFGLELFKVLFNSSKGENVFISPFSISVALAMTHIGAREKTARDMAQALQWQSPEAGAKIHEQFRSYISALQQTSDQYKLSTANRIYIEKTYNVLKDFITATQVNYLAEPVSANFKGDFNTERQQINKWVEQQTQDKIQNFLAEGVLNSDTRMVLVNAIYFKGNWAEQFEPRATRPMPFKSAPGKTKDVQMMFTKKKFPYNVDRELGCSVISIPYKGKDLSMVIFLPDEDFGLEALVQKLTAEKMNSVISQIINSHEVEVELFLPRFEIESGKSLKEPLTAMGMGEAFDENKADFSGMTGDRDLVVSEVVHKAFIKVNEEGTEAAAATAVIMLRRCAFVMPEIPPQFKVDHPFLFSIVDRRARRTLLFLGHAQNIVEK